MERYIHLENIALFRKRLADPNLSDTEREVLQELLAEEEARVPPVRKSSARD